VKTGGGTHRTSWGRSPIQWIVANGKTPPALPPSEHLNRYVEDLNDCKTDEREKAGLGAPGSVGEKGDYFSILLRKRPHP